MKTSYNPLCKVDMFTTSNLVPIKYAHMTFHHWNPERLELKWFARTIAQDGIQEDSGPVGLGRPPSHNFLLTYLNKSIAPHCL